MCRKIIIVGAGPAGVSAAVQLTRLGHKPRLFDSTGHVGGLLVNARRIENYPGFAQGISGPEFIGHLSAILARWKIDVEQAHLQTITPDDEGFSLTFAQKTVKTSRVILATGTLPIELPELKPASIRIFYEVAPLLAAQPREVLIIGGGEASFDYALSLADRAIHVTLAFRGEFPRAQGVLVFEAMENPFITLSPLTVLSGISPSGVPHVLQNGVPIEFPGAALLVATGRRSTCSTFSLPCDGSPFTKHRGLFIAGDMRLGGLGQLGCAVGDGLYAAFLAARSNP
ncbi:NAD(P)/FAD-dependent oxidoreductase [Myxococcota bacterium]|nr:NAD(P)/FAD-dependent oxidoreductase [Myxococcota bacterium]MBU1537528.1 NAD(P)/FAD-dependent oxidoreductase [Myxococcota bacterium]